MLYYFAGEDRYQVRLAIEDIAQREKAKIKWLDLQEAKEVPPREWVAGAVSLFEKNIIVIRGVEVFSAALQKSVVDAALTLAQSPATVILWEGKSTKQNILKKKLKAYTQEFVCPAESVLVSWLEKEAAKRGSVFEKNAARVLVERVGDDRWLLLSELEKLSLQHEVITAQQIKEILPEQLETTVFIMLDSLVRGDQAAVAQAVEQLIESGAGELYILSMLAYQFRTLLSIRQALQKGEQPQDLKPYVIQKNTPIAQRFSASQFLDILTRVLATDFAIKQGTVEARTALWLLITGLTAQMQQARRVTSPSR